MSTTIAILFASCGKKAPVSNEQAFANYIAAYTTGIVQTRQNIEVELVEAVPSDKEIDLNDLFDITPSIDGHVERKGEKSFVFVIEERLAFNKDYTVTFHLSELVETPKELENFVFQIKTLAQNYTVNPSLYRYYDFNNITKLFAEGTIYLSDAEEIEDIQQTLTAEQNGKKLPVSFSKGEGTGTYNFQVDSIIRGENASVVLLKFDASHLGVDFKENQELAIPSLKDFKLESSTAVSDEPPYLQLMFSDPLQAQQNLNGLITISAHPNLTFTINGNEIKVFSGKPLKGSLDVFVSEGIKNILGYKLPAGYNSTVNFESLKPAVKFQQSGTILPGSTNLTIHFQAVNLKYVALKITEIYASNVGQFLQINNLDENNELHRVGRNVVHQLIDLTQSENYVAARWTNYEIDLADLITPSPGTIYQVSLDIRKPYTALDCTADNAISFEELSNQLSLENNDRVNGYYYYEDDEYYVDDYNWREREDPCKSSYYAYNNQKVEVNIMSTDIGLIAKSNELGEIVLFATNLLTAKPESGVEIQLLNYQLQPIISGKTDSDGMLQLKATAKPFLAVAKKDKHITYLKLDDAKSNPIGMFDVGGDVVQAGAKGFIYGERGVWRPGDSLYLSFMIDDPKNLYLEKEPVVLTLSNPSGVVVTKMIQPIGANKLVTFRTKVEHEAPTGLYQAIVKIGGAQFTKTLRIENVRPNRLKIDLKLQTAYISALSSNLNAKVAVNWLFGTPVANSTLKIDATTEIKQDPFAKFKAFNFSNKEQKYYSEELDVYTGTTNSEGISNVFEKLNFNGKFPGYMQLNLKVAATETAGDITNEYFTVGYSPYVSYAGLMLPNGNGKQNLFEIDKDYTFQVASVSENGTAISKNLEVTLFKTNWQWWWENDNNSNSSYNSNRTKQEVWKSTVATNSGKGTFKLNRKGSEWGRYLIEVKDLQSGHIASEYVYFDYPGWGSLATRNDPDGASMLTFTADKATYNLKEVVNVSFPSSEGSRALITIENGTEIISTKWVDTKAGTTQYQFEAVEEMAPAAYVHIMLIQPHAQTANSLPIRMYGVIPIEVENSATHLYPVIEVANELKPNQEFTVTVSEKNNAAMNYTLAIVDEGLLSLTHFKTPDAWKHFNQKEALGIKTWDMFKDVIGAFNGKSGKLLATGGDSKLDLEEARKTQRFKPAVLFIGPIKSTGGKQSHTFKMPNYIGAVRVMVVANNGKEAYGNVEKTVAVKQPLMLLTSLPRKMGPSERVALPITVFVDQALSGTLKIEVKTDGKKLVCDEPIQTLEVKGGEYMAMFEVEAGTSIGKGTVEVTASLGGNKAFEKVDIPIDQPNAKQTSNLSFKLAAGEKLQLSPDDLEMSNADKYSFEAATVPIRGLEKVMNYILEYPYGCAEQVTSKGYAQLLVPQFANVDENLKKQYEANVKAAIARLNTYANNDGGLSYWPGYYQSEEWVSVYALQFLTDAQKVGHVIPAGLRENLTKFIKSKATSFSFTNYTSEWVERRQKSQQAYRLFVLAMINEPDLGAMNRLKEHKYSNTFEKILLAAAYGATGKKDIGKSLLSGISGNALTENYYSPYGSKNRDLAFLAMAFKLNGLQAMAESTLNTALESFYLSKYFNTHEIGILLSAAKLVYNLDQNSELNIALKENGKNVSIQKGKPIYSGNVKSGGKLDVTNNGTAPIYITLSGTGYPKPTETASNSNGLFVGVKYTVNGVVSNNLPTLHQGDQVTASATIINSTSQFIENIAFTLCIPNGGEINDVKVVYQPNKESDYSDIKDNKVIHYFALNKGESRILDVKFTAAYTGLYFLPSSYAEDMYHPEINGNSPSYWINLLKK